MGRVSPHAQSSDYLALGRAVGELRERRGVSQHVASFDAGMSRNYFGLLERGKASPNFAVLLRIVRMFGSSMGELVESFERHVAEIDPDAGQDVRPCPTPEALARQAEVNAEVHARNLAAIRRGRMRMWT
jgi:transcriptional regulator with XRE-family HTH domain